MIHKKKTCACSVAFNNTVNYLACELTAQADLTALCKQLNTFFYRFTLAMLDIRCSVRCINVCANVNVYCRPIRMNNTPLVAGLRSSSCLSFLPWWQRLRKTE